MANTVYKNYSEAANSLPADAKWSASFGCPGEGGYVEYYRDSAGVRYVIANGSWESSAPFAWTVDKV